MNYNMQGITETIPKLFVMLKSTKVEIKKSIKCWWLTRPLYSRKGQRDRKGTSRRMTNKLSLPWRSPKLDQSLKLSASTAKEMVTGSGTALDTWRIRRMAKWTKVNFDIQIIDVYFTSAQSNPWVFDTGLVGKISNSKWELQNEQRLVKGEVMMCVGSGSKIDMIIIAHSLYFRD